MATSSMNHRSSWSRDGNHADELIGGGAGREAAGPGPPPPSEATVGRRDKGVPHTRPQNQARSAPGRVVWLTGLPSAGKTTIAALAAARLAQDGHRVQHLDGDAMRTQLSKDLGFSKHDRDENVRRIGFVAGLLASHGVTVLVSAVSPYRAIREELRAGIANFLEVHVATELAICKTRDVKGLYARWARGELSHLTGLDDPYEPPMAPELVIRTEHEPPMASAERVLVLLQDRTTRDHADPPMATIPAGAPSSLPAPHGGELVDRLVDGHDADGLVDAAKQMPVVMLDDRGLADLECLTVGAFSPLRGFMGSADHAAVVAEGRLANGLIWTLPVVLSVDPALVVGAPDRLALARPNGALLGVIDVEEVFPADALREAAAVYGTVSPDHPGVAVTLSRPGPLVAGPVHVLGLPAPAAGLGPRLTPAQVRAEAVARGWRSMAGFQTRNPVHRAHEYLQKVALEYVDGLLVHPLVGETKDDDVPAMLRMACYRAVLETYFPPSRILLSGFPAAMRYAGPREAVFHAVVRKNYGCTHFIVGRDHAGVGSYYGTYAAQKAFDAYDPAELGVVPVKFEQAFYCRRCEGPASTRTCPHSDSAHTLLSGTAVRNMLRRGQTLPPEFTRPEVASLLSDHFRTIGD
jgi:sulfate adenylyltransferase